MSNIMLDLETYGRKRGCQVLSIGAVEFGPEGVGQEFYTVLELSQQAELGLTAEPETVEWWSKQSAEARKVLTDEPTAFTDGLLQFKMFCAKVGGKKDLLMWGNGSDFDNPILSDAFEAAGLDIPWIWYNNRCYRTLKGFRKDMKIPRGGTHHNALDDARSQAVHAVQLMEVLGLWR